MPFRPGIGKELTRSTICVRRSRATVTLMCSDRIPAGAASELFVGIHWTNFEDDVTLTFRKLTSAGGGEVRFGDAAGPASRTFPSATRQLVRIFGVTPTAGADPDVMLDVAVGDEVLDHIPISVGPPPRTVAIRAADGVTAAPDLVLPAVPVKLKAVPNPAGAGTFQWLTVQPALVSIAGSATAAEVELRPGGTPAPALTAPDGSVGVCVLFTPASGSAVMAVLRTWTLFDPEKPGPFKVGRATYTAPEFTIAGPREGVAGAVKVSMEALVRYPADVPGASVPFSTRRPKYPLVILAHGRHPASEVERHADGRKKRNAVCATTPILIAGVHPEFKNHEGLEYLANHLASNGFVAVSINLNGKFDPVTGTGEIYAQTFHSVSCHTTDKVAIAHRGLAILRHITVMKAKHGGGDPLFAGKIDLDNIGLIGHSRGGEAVAAAQVINKGLPAAARAKIKSVTSIAPTDFRGHRVDVPYQVIVGSDDGDVYSVDGCRLYDRATAPKHLVWVVGGIHNFFSSNWQWQDEVPAAPPVSRPQHQAIANGYANLFLQGHLRGVTGTVPYLAGDRRLGSITGVELHHSLRVAGGKLVDDFETLPKNKARNALAKVVTGTDLVSFDEEHLNELNPGCAPSRPSWFQDTNGLVLEWAAATASYSSDVGSLDASADGMVLSFRVGQDVTGNPPAAPQKFKVTLTDALARSATLRVQDFATIPPPRTKNVITGLMPPGCTPVPGSVTLCSLKTVRLPVARFKAANSALDTAAIASVTFAFDTTPVGRLAIDDLEFSL